MFSPSLTKKRNDVSAIPNAETSELGQEVLNERSEFRNLTLVDKKVSAKCTVPVRKRL